MSSFLARRLRPQQHTRRIAARASKRISSNAPGFEARTAKQGALLRLLHEGPPIVVVAGAAGSGKTACAAAVGVAKLLSGEVSKIVIARPTVTSGEGMGFLPGDVNAKLWPFSLPVIDCLNKHVAPAKVRAMINDDVIELCPLAYVRGRTFERSWVILDEAQNCRSEGLMTVMSRLGAGSRLVITGDTEQSDLGPDNGLTDLLERLEFADPADFGVIEFGPEDIVRHRIVSKVLALYKPATA
jgi:phosphate starvation-inducible protein PhoH and related proteins